MEYNIKAHPTKYNGVQFRSRLEARWAAFFDLAGWKWEYEPIDLKGWSPDFRVTFSNEDGSPWRWTHTLLVEVKPYFSIEEFAGHRCLDFPFGGLGDERIPADASAAFGANPDVTWWEMTHGDGGGEYELKSIVFDADDKWAAAGNIVQWHK